MLLTAFFLFLVIWNKLKAHWENCKENQQKIINNIAVSQCSIESMKSMLIHWTKSHFLVCRQVGPFSPWIMPFESSAFFAWCIKPFWECVDSVGSDCWKVLVMTWPPPDFNFSPKNPCKSKLSNVLKITAHFQCWWITWCRNDYSCF